MSPSPEFIKERFLEAARYALLRRLAPALRHDMAGILQPISMMAAILEKRLQKPEPDLAALAKNSGAINNFARDAGSACMGLMTWLAPRDDALVDLHDGVAEALALVTTELAFGGFNVVNETSGVHAAVPLSVLRGAFMASVLSLTDASSAPGELVCSAQLTDDEVILRIVLAATDGDAPFVSGKPAYRVLAWDDVQAIAQSQGVAVTREAASVELRCPR